MLGSIDSCQNRVSADQYHLTVSRAQVLTHTQVEYLFEVIRWQATSFQMIAGSSLIFSIHMKYAVFYMCHTIKILISNWPRKLKFSQFLQAGKTSQLLLTFLTKVRRWSRSTSNFYALICDVLNGFQNRMQTTNNDLINICKKTCYSICGRHDPFCYLSPIVPSEHPVSITSGLHEHYISFSLVGNSLESYGKK